MARIVLKYIKEVERDLISCPFCGSEDLYIDGDGYGAEHTTCVRCGKCKASGPAIFSYSDKDAWSLDSQEKACIEWNKLTK